MLYLCIHQPCSSMMLFIFTFIGRFPDPPHSCQELFPKLVHEEVLKMKRATTLFVSLCLDLLRVDTKHLRGQFDTTGHQKWINNSI